ncbi:MAG TPA: methyltransferase domain-containing protein [Acetobacteraceae bacterium]|nr:methyltransferase domain-containing protein [Acetobacteraceae bacterium]
MSTHGVCPWWAGYLLASPLRRLQCDPAAVLAPYVRAGMTVLEPGPGMGFFTLELARKVGATGRVIAVDVQSRMISGLRRRATKAGLSGRIDARVAEPDTLGVDDLANQVDFVFAFAVVHEMPSAAGFFAQAAWTMKPGSLLLLAEPAGHVDQTIFDAELAAARAVSLTVQDRPAIRRSIAVALRKDPDSQA